VNVAGGEVTHPAVAEAVGEECVPVEEALGQQNSRPQRMRHERGAIERGLRG
jgi:hypothetical protein